MSLEEERTLRLQIIQLLNADFLENGPFTLRKLLDYSLPGVGALPLIDRARGIRNPQHLAATLAVVSSSSGPYPDEPLDGGLMRYAYQGRGPDGDNVKLRAAGDLGLPIILFLKPEANCYIPIAPSYVVADDRRGRAVTIAVDESARDLFHADDPVEAQRRYAEQRVQVRLHQRLFRGIVLRAYETQCAICNFRHGRLLDAAHIVPDRATAGRAAVDNGMALCKIHHAAYDENLLGITPSHRVEVNSILLNEIDGPMLKHGLQEMHGARIFLPQRQRDRPAKELLELRYSEFLAAGP